MAQKLRKAGAEVKLSKGNKGAEDMVAQFSTKKWLIQCKATRSGQPQMHSTRELGRLKQKATKNNATPVIALVSGNDVEFVSARSKRKLKS